MIRALLIPADPTQPLTITQTTGLADLQRLVDGNVEVAPLSTDRLTLWINEDGKARRLPRNDRADAYWKASIPATLPGDYIAGDAVITGLDPDSGDDVDVPQAEDFAALLRAGRFRAIRYLIS